MISTVRIECLRFTVNLLMGCKFHLIILDEGNFHMSSDAAASSHWWDGISFPVVVVYSEFGLYYNDLYFQTVFKDLW